MRVFSISILLTLCLLFNVDAQSYSFYAQSSSSSISIDTTMTPLYEYRDFWAEEGGTLNANTAEWSYANGAVGFIGLTIDEGWEVTAIYFHADTYSANATIQVDLMDYGNTASNAAANTITSISLSNSTDGGGATNNAYKYMTMTNPVPITTTGGFTVLGFITRTKTGTITDARVGVRLRRKVGEYVSDISIN